jgi:Ran GTPase-activating protein (RanGAP) involved in mRNA processing and transport
MEEQQQQQPLHRGVVSGIARLADPRWREQRHKLFIDGDPAPMDRRSLQHLVDFLDGRRDSHHEDIIAITELELAGIRLIEPSDGGVNVLEDFFARSDTTLTKLVLRDCNFGTTEDALQVLAAIHTNGTVIDLTISGIQHLEGRGAALGACLSGVLQNMPQLHRLDCPNCHLGAEGVRALQSNLQANRTLRELSLVNTRLGDEGVSLLADALVRNTTVQEINICNNGITANGLDDITRLLQSTQLKKMELCHNVSAFDSEAITRRFARALSRHAFLTDLDLSHCRIRDKHCHWIVDGLVGNTRMKALDIRGHYMTPLGLAEITRLLESTQLETISFWWSMWSNKDVTQRFVYSLQHKNCSVQDLSDLERDYFPGKQDVQNSLKRNQQLNRVNLLLAPPPPPPLRQQQQQQQQQRTHAGTMMLKVYHKAITQFATAPNNAGACAIFKLFQARPAILEKRLKRPTTTAAITAAVLAPEEQTR